MRKRKINGYWIVLGILLLAYVLIEFFRPRPTDWTPTYVRTDKIPYGTYALYELMADVFPDEPVEAVRMPVYNVLEDSLNTRGNYIFINREFSPDPTDLHRLLDFAAAGNHVFIAAELFDKTFSDTLKFSVKPAFNRDTLFSFTNPRLQSKQYVFPAQIPGFYFQPLDTGSTEIVSLARNKHGDVNFVRIPFGKGYFLLHAHPKVFTNYHVLNEKAGDEYAFKALSYLPVAPVWWDEYYKQGREGDVSLLRVITHYRPIRWAYYTALAGILLFVLFKGKRRQRVIPVMAPLKNTSREFVQVVSSLYYNQKDFADITRKKITFFLDHIRQQFNEPRVLGENPDDGHFQQALAAKTGIEPEEIKELFGYISYIQHLHNVTEEDLIQLNQRIEEFYKKTKQ